nr:peptidylprolyl isomerase [Croceicoccus gelatinilyticus]
MRFALRPDAVTDPGDAELRKYFEANKADYAESDLVTFEHVFFDAARGGAENAAQRASAFKPGNDWQAAGDRFAYQRTYVGVRAEQVSAQLGEGFAEQVFALEPTPAWQGPIQSDLGAHLVRVVRHDKSGEPEFADLRPVVLDDWLRERQSSDLEKRVDAIVSSYDSQIDPALTQ